jgi:DHA2 family multidrug resistance protein
MCVGMFMAILDIQIVATSLPVIQNALHMAPDQMSWVQTAYLIAEVIAIPLTGYFTRVFTMRGLFLIAVGAFVVASMGCAFSTSYESLIACRVVQGFAGGAIIPLVFSAVFILFTGPQQIACATMIAGVSAVIAPTLGPILGGWITQTYSWPYLFLINVLPGLFVLGTASTSLPRGNPEIQLLRKIDWVSLAFLAISLAAFELALKDGPKDGWVSPKTAMLFALALIAGYGMIHRCAEQAMPLLDVRIFRDRNFAVASALSFTLGAGLFGSIYLMPVFLGFVRQHGPIEIGAIMLVTGVAQIMSAPIAVRFERKFPPAILTACGFLVFAAGLALGANQTPATDYDGMFWPQVLRGAAIMFCLLPPTTIALSRVSAERVPDASALFNLMRNMGGAVGIALVDTIIWQRVEGHTSQLTQDLLAGDTSTAEFIGLPLSSLQAGGPAGAHDIAVAARPLLEKAGLVMAINEAWLVIAVMALIASCAVLLLKRDADGMRRD